VEACPYGLNPSDLSIACEAQDWERAQGWDLLECKECGCCSFVCPAKRQITHLVKFGKFELAKRRKK
jgi:electron transport complex protein RnfC